MTKFQSKISEIIISKHTIIALAIVLSLVASIQSLVIGPKHFEGSEYQYTRYNNYTIFEKSFHHLIDGKDLYIEYPEEHWDLYKYTPTFSVFFGFFALMPDWLGLNLWNLLNSIVLLVGIYLLPKLTEKQKGAIGLIVLIELMTSLQNAQSNGLIVGLLLITFSLLEQKNYLFASLMIILSAYIKLFSIVGIVLFIFYPKKWKSASYAILWIILLALVPLVFIGIDEYILLSNSYIKLLTSDHSVSYGLSVMGLLYTWFGISISKNIVVIIGIIIFLLPLIRIKQYSNYFFRLLMLSSLLIWLVVFNHKAESPTFIIAMTGVAIWFIISKKTTINITLLIIAIILTSLSPTDIFPSTIRNELVVPYVLKAIPCILIWFKVIYTLLFEECQKQIFNNKFI